MRRPMVEGGSGMPTTRRTDTASRILDVALRLVQVQGFNAFSYADVSAELRITKASLHHHFPTKAALGKALIVGYTHDFLAALDAIDRRGNGASAKLRAYVDIYVRVVRAERMCLCGMLSSDFATLPKAMRRELAAFFQANEKWLTRVIEEGRGAGELRFEGDASSAAEILVSSLEGAMLVARSTGGAAKFESIATNLLANIGVRA